MRSRSFQAWTDPDHVAQWFGPEGFVGFEFESRSAEEYAKG